MELRVMAIKDYSTLPRSQVSPSNIVYCHTQHALFLFLVFLWLGMSCPSAGDPMYSHFEPQHNYFYNQCLTFNFLYFLLSLYHSINIISSIDFSWFNIQSKRILLAIVYHQTLKRWICHNYKIKFIQCLIFFLSKSFEKIRLKGATLEECSRGEPLLPIYLC